MKSILDSASLITMGMLSQCVNPKDNEVWCWNSSFTDFLVVTVDDLLADPTAIKTACEQIGSNYIYFGGGNFPFINLAGLGGYTFVVGVSGRTAFVGFGEYDDGVATSFVCPQILLASDINFAAQVDGDSNLDFGCVLPTEYNCFFENCIFQQFGNTTGVNSVILNKTNQKHYLRNCQFFSAINCNDGLGGEVSIIGGLVAESISGTDVVMSGVAVDNVGLILSGVKGTAFAGDDLIYTDGTVKKSCKNIFLTSGITI